MSKVFLRKQFSNYLGENRALDDIIVRFVADIQPTPTPTPVPVTPTPTPTITPTNTATPTITPTKTSTPTPTPTDSRACRTYRLQSSSDCSIFTWTNCNGTPGTLTICFGGSTNTCAKQGSVVTTGGGSITDLGTCPLPTPTNTGSPTPTPTNTRTPVPTTTPTPSAPTNRTLGRIISTGGSLSGTTFGINYNSVVYPISTLFDPTNLSATIPVQYPQPGRLYNFVLVPDSGFTISSVSSSFGAWNRIRITTGASTGLNQWACVVDYMLNASVLFTDDGDTISVSNSSGFGQTWNINLTIGSGGPTFQVTAKELANELGDNLTTEDGDIIEIQS